MINLKCVNNYCCDDIRLIENYDEAINSNETYDCHHRLETNLNVTTSYLIDNDLYFNRPASELIFLSHSEHMRLHMKNKPAWNKGKPSLYKGVPRPEEVRKKISKSSIGKKKSDETRKKMSKSRLGYPSYIKGKHRVYREDGSFYMSY